MNDDSAKIMLIAQCPKAISVHVGRVDLKGKIKDWKGPDFIAHAVHIKGKTKRRKLVFTTVGELAEMTVDEILKIAKRHNDFARDH